MKTLVETAALKTFNWQAEELAGNIANAAWGLSEAASALAVLTSDVSDVADDVTRVLEDVSDKIAELAFDIRVQDIPGWPDDAARSYAATRLRDAVYELEQSLLKLAQLAAELDC